MVDSPHIVLNGVYSLDYGQVEKIITSLAIVLPIIH